MELKASLIITTYNRPDALVEVLKSVERQSLKPHEVIIADDGSSYETGKLIKDYSEYSKLEIQHAWHEDEGFRLSLSRNRAILKSTGNYIILIDGDMILERDFIFDHVTNAKAGFFCQGSRLLLSEELTAKILEGKNIDFHIFSPGISNKKHLVKSKILSSFFANRSKNDLRGIKTCNMSFFKDDCIKINGFNNDFIGWGREDTEFVVRLLNIGIKRRNLKFCAIQFHLWHPLYDRKGLSINESLLRKTIEDSRTDCDNGIKQLF